jgi:hypothetical protein
LSARQEDFVFAEHVLRRGFATEEQVQECLDLVARMRGEMSLDETLEAVLLKRGYLAPAQAQVISQTINPEAAGRSRNQIEGYRLLARLGSGAMGSRGATRRPAQPPEHRAQPRCRRVERLPLLRHGVRGRADRAQPHP